MMDKVLETPKKLDIAHPDKAVLFTDDVEKRREHQLEIFKKNNPRGDDRMCVDEWIGLAMDLFKKMIWRRGESTSSRSSRRTTPGVTTGCALMSGLDLQWTCSRR